MQVSQGRVIRRPHPTRRLSIPALPWPSPPLAPSPQPPPLSLITEAIPCWLRLHHSDQHFCPAGSAPSKGGYTGIFSSKSVSDKPRANSVTISDCHDFRRKKNRMARGVSPHLLLAWENRFYLEVRDCA